MKKLKIILTAVVLVAVGILIYFASPGLFDGKPGFSFSYKNAAMHDENNSQMWGKTEIDQPEWINSNTLKITSRVNINCFERIKRNSGDYEVSGDKIILKYSTTDCGESCAMCLSTEELTYTIKNLPKKDYQFEIESSSLTK